MQNSPLAQYSVGIQFASVISNYYVSTTSAEGSGGGDIPMPTGRWACFEWQFDGMSTALNA
jgi:hypothetical protein